MDILLDWHVMEVTCFTTLTEANYTASGEVSDEGCVTAAAAQWKSGQNGQWWEPLLLCLGQAQIHSCCHLVTTSNDADTGSLTAAASHIQQLSGHPARMARGGIHSLHISGQAQLHGGQA